MARKQNPDMRRIIDSILADVCDAKPLHKACKENGITAGTFYNWTLKDPAIVERLARAREVGSSVLFGEMIEIADIDPERGGDGKIDQGDVANRKLRVWAREQVAKSLNPTLQKMQLSGDANNPIVVKKSAAELTDDELASIIAKVGKKGDDGDND